MRTFRFRPLERLEDRATPATMADVQWAYATAQANAATLRALSADPAWMANPAFSDIVQSFTQMVWRNNTAAAGILADAGGGSSMAGAYGQALANAGFATSLANMLDFSVVPPPAPNDNGMVDTMPDINSPSWQLQANGLKIWDVVQGNGAPFAAGDIGRVFYSGWLASNGNLFDDGRPPDEPFRFALSPTTIGGASGVIQGWVQGLAGMEPGGIRRLYIPAALAYGDQSRTGIPPNSDLVFEVKLISHT
jgi:FKBP-type peptidyl-prolyl cis-trans isomerase